MFDKIIAHTSFIGETGYANHSREFFTALNKLIPVKIRNFTVGKTWNGIGHGEPHNNEWYLTDEHKEMLYKQTCIDDGVKKDFYIYGGDEDDEKGNVLHIVLNEVNHYYFYDNYNGPKIAYNVWESTLYPENFYNKLLEFDQLWVPTKWQRDCVVKQGYDSEKVKVVPEAVDGNIFFPEEIKEEDKLEEYNDGRFKFLLFGRWDYRKSTTEIIDIFLKTFDKNEPVDLVVSIDNPFSFDEFKTTEERLKKYGFNDNRIKVKHFPSREEYIYYLKSGHIFLSCARSEGWNLPLIEAMACGNPSIYSNWGGQLEFALGKGIPINIIGERKASLGTLKSFNNKIEGNYCEPDFQDLSHKMRDTYINYPNYKKKALVESKEIKKEFTWENVSKKALSNICDIFYTWKEDKKNNIKNVRKDIHLKNKQHISFITAGNKKYLLYSLECIKQLEKYSPNSEKYFYAFNFDVDDNNIFLGNKVKNLKINKMKSLSNLCDNTFHFAKIRACIDAINNINSDYYIWIDSDANALENIDNIFKYCPLLQNYPLCPIYLDENIFQWREINGVKKTSYYGKEISKEIEIQRNNNFIVCANLFIFNKKCKKFFEEVINIGEELRNKNINDLFVDDHAFSEERIFNSLFWKYNYKNHLPITWISKNWQSNKNISLNFTDYDLNNIFDNDYDIMFEYKDINDINIKKENIILFHSKLCQKNINNPFRNKGDCFEKNKKIGIHGIDSFDSSKEWEYMEVRYEKKDNKIYFQNFGPNIKKAKVVIRDNCSNLFMGKYDLTFKKDTIVWIKPFFANLYDINFKEFLVEFYNNNDKILYSVIVPVKDCYPPDNFKFDNSTKDTTWINYYEMFYRKIYDDFIQEVNGGVAVDIGANRGIFTRYALKKGYNKCYSIEPSSDSFLDLCRTFGSDTNVLLFNNAISDSDGVEILYVPKDAASLSSFDIEKATNNNGNDYYKDYAKIPVKTFSLGSFISCNQISFIDLLKVDIEGAEYKVFESIDENILRDKIDKIILEFHFNDGRIEKIIEKLKKCGFLINIREQSTKNKGDICLKNGIIFASKNTHKDKIDFNIYYDIEKKSNEDLCKIYITPKNLKREQNYTVFWRDADTDILIYKAYFLMKNGINYWLSYRYKYMREAKISIKSNDGIEVYSKNIIINSEENPHFSYKLKTRKDNCTWKQLREIFYENIYCNNKNMEICNGDVIVDLGANNGFFSLKSVDKGASKVYAVEANKETCKYLYDNININNKYKNIITPFCFGIGGENRKDTINIYNSSGLDSIYEVNDQFKPIGKQNIQIIDINKFLSDNKINHIDLLKIDIEGSEFEVIESISESFLSSSVDRVAAEIHLFKEHKLEEINNKLERCGFNISIPYKNKDEKRYIIHAWKPIKKYAFICTWNGNLPYWFDYFLTSCEANKDYDWLIFTDTNIPSNLPKNVKFINQSIDDFSILASKKLGENINVKNTYKLCDYKTLYGKIYEDYLQEYKYWGFCDIDVIWGNLNTFVEEYISKGVDIISFGGEDIDSLHYRVAGPCTLVRNRYKNNMLFSNIPDIYEILNSEKCYSITEKQWDKIVKNDNDIKLKIIVGAQKHNDGKVWEEAEWRKKGLFVPNGKEIAFYHMLYKNKVFKKNDQGFFIKDAENYQYDKDVIFVTGGDEKFLPLMEICAESFSRFSNHKMIVYGYNFDIPFDFPNIIKKRINLDVNEKETKYDGRILSLSFAKEKCCIDAINTSGFKNFVWIDSDSFVTKYIDRVTEYIQYIDNYPIINSHIYDFIIDSSTKKIIGDELAKEKLNIYLNKRSIYPWLHACLFVFNSKCKWFFEETLNVAYSLSPSEREKYFNKISDEQVINLLMWKNNFKNKMKVHDYDIQFKEKTNGFFKGDLETCYKTYMKGNISYYAKLPKKYSDIYIMHGQKNVDITRSLYNKYLLYFDKKNISSTNANKKTENKPKYLICLDSKSLGDNLAWMPYAEELRIKNNCKVVLATFWNNLFEKEYPEIEFVKPGTVVYNINKHYNIGWYTPWDPNKNPNDYRTIPLQQTASDILGIDFKEIKPKITIPDKPRNIKEKYICIGIHSTCQSKYWNYPNGWQEIVNYLNGIGYKVVHISKEKGIYMGNTPPNGVIDKTGDISIEDRIIDLKYSDMFIGIGSGLSWLSWAVGTPTILISGFSNPMCEPQNNIERVFNPNVCNSCFNDPNIEFDKGDWNWCPRKKEFECSKNITPDMVIEKINKILNL